MPEKETLQRARADKRAGKASSTQAGEFVREEIHHVREGKHGARSTKQAIAIGLSKARRAGVKLPACRHHPLAVIGMDGSDVVLGLELLALAPVMACIVTFWHSFRVLDFSRFNRGSP